VTFNVTPFFSSPLTLAFSRAAERLIPYLEQLLRCPFHTGRDLLLDFFFRGLLQLVAVNAARSSGAVNVSLPRS
jgi:hypothetical protein